MHLSRKPGLRATGCCNSNTFETVSYIFRMSKTVAVTVNGKFRQISHFEMQLFLFRYQHAVFFVVENK